MGIEYLLSLDCSEDKLINSRVNKLIQVSQLGLVVKLRQASQVGLVVKALPARKEMLRNVGLHNEAPFHASQNGHYPKVYKQ